jgi:hypothetical protein
MQVTKFCPYYTFGVLSGEDATCVILRMADSYSSGTEWNYKNTLHHMQWFYKTREV